MHDLPALQGRDINKDVIDAVHDDTQVLEQWKKLTRVHGGLEEHNMELLTVVWCVRDG